MAIVVHDNRKFIIEWYAPAAESKQLTSGDDLRAITRQRDTIAIRESSKKLLNLHTPTGGWQIRNK
jgi:hypothetical protein